jgi:FkbM family methyltransferase
MILNLNFKGSKIKIYLERHCDFSSFYNVFVSNSYPNIISKINKGDIVIDAGANIGVFSIMASILTGKTGRVIAIEPDPDHLKILKRNLELNNIHNVIIYRKCLYSKSGEIVKFHQNGLMSKIISQTDVKPNNYIEVETITLDEIISDLNIEPKILKMDIEGAEKFALLSCHNTFKAIEYFEMEIHDLECYNALLRYSDLFLFRYEPIESLRNVLKFFFKHPLKTLNLELHNKFLTTKRVLVTRIKRKKAEKFPVIIYGQKLRNAL